MDLPYHKEFFDYIIFGDVLEHLREPEQILKKMESYLIPGGHIITSIPNIMNAQVIFELLHGYFTYQDSGILDRTHLRFFTEKEIYSMFTRAGYRIDEMRLKSVYGLTTTSAPYKEFFNQLLAIDGIASRDAFDTFQYLVLATKQ